ncbi:protein-disulfide reductase DsbD domain-containing protein [Paraflavitalea soli]|nr:protein-disulfide reductase DsbD domain-containing protein [Paraflavitalea soli]
MRSKQLLTAICFLALPILASAQVLSPVNWNFSSKKINAQTWQVQITATIQSGWHLYAQEAGEGPVPTTIKFTQNPLVTASGKLKEVGKLRKSFDRNFNAELKYYENQVSFVQTVTLVGKAATDVRGSIEFMVCNDHECLPPRKVDFKVAVGGK